MAKPTEAELLPAPDPKPNTYGVSPVPDLSNYGVRGEAFERELAPGGSFDLLGKLLELTPFPAQKRLAQKQAGDYQYQSDEDYGGDVAATTPLIGLAAGPLIRLGRGAKKVASAVADDVAKQAPKVIDEVKPGFLKTAEDLIAERGGGARPALEAVEEADEAYALGFRPDKVREAAGDDVADILIRDAELDRVNAGSRIASEAQRRGVVPVEETIGSLSYQTGLNTEKIAKTAAGKAFNAEEMVQLDRSMKSAGEKVLNFQRVLSEMPNTLENAGARQQLEVRLMAASTEMARLRQVFSGARAESGRAQNILKYVNRVAAEPTQLAYEEAMDAIGGRANAQKFIKALNDIYASQLSPQEKINSTYSLVAKLGKPSLWDKFGEFFTSSILTGIPTHVVNTVSSAGLGLMEVGAKFVGAGIDAGVTLGGLRRPREVFFSEAAARALGMMRGSGAALRAAKAFATSDVPASVRVGTRDIALAPTKFDTAVSGIQRRALEGKIGEFLTIPLKALGTEDTFIKAWTLRGGLEEAAAKIAAKERKSFWNGDMGRRIQELVADPTDEMIEFAQKQAAYVTLQSDPGKVAAAFLGVRRDLPGLRFAIPFITTPANILGRAGEYSPLGVFNVAKAGSAEGRAMAAARATIGTAFMLPFVNMALEGRLTGGWPKDAAERDEWIRTGKRPYAMKMGNDWVEFRRFEPIATPMYVMATAYDAYRRGAMRGENLDVVAQKMISAMVRSVADATYFSGLSRLIDAIEDPEASGERFLTNVLSGFVAPAGFLRTAAAAADPYERNPQGVWEEILSLIPGARESIAPRRDAFGRAIERPPSKQGLLALVNPLVVSPERKDTVDTAIEQVFRTNKFDASGNPIPSQRLRVGFTADEVAGFQLGPTEADRLQELAGTETYQRLERLFVGVDLYNGRSFASLSKDDQRKAVESTVDKSRTFAKGVLADELMRTAESGGEVFRAASMRLSTLGSRANKAMYLYGLSQTKSVDPEVMAAIDARKAPSDPTFVEMVGIGKLVTDYKASPRWVEGIVTPQEEQAVERNIAIYKQLIKGKSAEQIKSDETLLRFYYESDGGLMQYLYSMSGGRKTKYVNPRRLEIEASPLWKKYSIDPE